MKKYLTKFFIILLCISNISFAASGAASVETQGTRLITAKTDIKCRIDGLNVKCYAIDGFMYIPVEELKHYGFVLDGKDNGISIERAVPASLDGTEYNGNADETYPVYKTDTNVFINENIANAYLVNNEIVIQADELSAFGKVNWQEETKTFEITIIQEEILSHFENMSFIEQEQRIEVDNFGYLMKGETVNGVPEGWCYIGYFQSPGYYGYVINGRFEGTVFMRQEHKPYLAALSGLQTYKDGILNGYYSYKYVYNNKPPYIGELMNKSGVCENGVMKNGKYTTYTEKGYKDGSYNIEYDTYEIKDFAEYHIVSKRYSEYYDTINASVVLDGKLLDFGDKLITENDRTLVPMRTLFEKMGAEVIWNQEDNSATVIKGNDKIKFVINHYDIAVNEETKYMDSAVRLVEGKTMIPIRFISENLGYTVTWDEKNQIIEIQ